ncbi:GNAT family N-acetyltransferase [Psychroflexus sp. YR1-1]|uniref:GNAT family N-acetyltransferase n=1 Tax=Psychroflexus aurantiacus TaxID=2709310 RepID=A0A6B3R6D8_9FLAO|nr:GNAT family N-acetyltransferase [Psychroflexus aurantiacus]NEV93024.1 GNAT family N-acetyltransferase [Psychroflexus aurantiacus]
MKFREAKDEDWKQISQIFNDYWGQGFDSKLNLSLKTKFNNRHAFYNFWVIEKESKILGWSASFRVFESPLRENCNADLCIYVNKNSLAKGVGNLLMKKTISLLKTSEIKLVFGHIEPNNLISKKMAKRHGFTYSNIEYKNSIHYNTVELWLLSL